ncbi:MAG: SCP2 sterol-binding domain-containing protein [Halobacteria archaeon]|nr:SCP2 sterol-binding domain-containing protein [Halobacteria archaeon]
MAVDFPTEDWIEEWKEKLNDNEEYAELGADWGLDFNGDFIFTIEPDVDDFEDDFSDDLADDGNLHYFVGLEGGKCTEVYLVEEPDDENYGFQITGPYSNWKKLCQGEIGAIDGLMSGKFELNGDMQKVMQYSDAAVTMVESATSIETNFKY